MFSGVIGISAAYADPSIELAPAASLALIPAASCTIAAPTALTAPTARTAGANLDGVFDGTALRATQVDVAATIVKVGKDLGITDRGIKIALAVAMDASSLTPTVVNVPFVGLYQQQSDPASGLYEDQDRADAAGAATMFFNQLTKRVPGYDTDTRADWQLGEIVQESGHGREFDQWAGLAAQLLITVTAAPQLVDVPTVDPTVAGMTATLQPTAFIGRPVAAGFNGTINLSIALPALRGSGSAFAAAAVREVDTVASPDPVTGSTASVAPADPTDAAGPDLTSPDSADSNSLNSPTTETTSPDPAGTDPTGTDPSGTDTTAGPTGTNPSAGPTTTDPTTIDPTTTDPTTTDSGVPSSSPTETTDPALTPDPTTSAPVITPDPPVTTEPAPVTVPGDNVGGDGSIIVPEAPEPPVPTGTGDDPQVGDEIVPEGTAGTTSQRGVAAAEAPAVLDCAPNTNGGSTTFDAGEIISDAVFYNSAAMTASQVNAFIQEKGAACQGEFCLRNLRVSTPNVAADKYCAAYAGGTNETAAAIIAKVSVACRVNPQVMLVTLQKESALLTKTSVSLASYNAAWGWHCPDTGPGGTANCNPAYAGFFNQAMGMAKQWSRYVVDPLKYNYQAGETTQILWNVVESGCGSGPVTIRNTATASLYNYTPYQPNTASLAAYPGVGDRCSTYGNRNFFFLFQKYFGVTGGGAPAYVVVNGVSVTIPAGPHVAAAAAGQVITAPNEAVAKGIAAGLASVGLPYVWGGGSNNGPADQGCSRGGGSSNSCQGTVGFDCSGLTGYVMSQAGFATGTNSAAQRSSGTSVPWQQALAGDIIGYNGHVAIYLGKIKGVDYLLESPTVGMYVQVRPVYMTNNGLPVDSVLHRYWR